MKALTSLLSILSLTGLAALTLGCQPRDTEVDDDAEELPVPARRPQSGGGSQGGTGTGNHYLPGRFLEALPETTDSFSSLIALEDTHVASVMMTPMFATVARRESFQNAAECALAANDYVEYIDPSTSNKVSINGQGIIKGAETWHGAKLTNADYHNGVLTCMAARLNPFGVAVPLMLLGPQINKDGVTNSDDYPYVEMVISAVMGAERKVDIHVWPQDDLKETCGAAVEGSLGTRLCDNNPGSCGLVLRHDFDTACVGSEGDWTCDGKPAIEVRLQKYDVDLLHPECAK